ncbi:MAG: DUF2059 domain-containing protein [Pseudomonadota bacterium]
MITTTDGVRGPGAIMHEGYGSGRPRDIKCIVSGNAAGSRRALRPLYALVACAVLPGAGAPAFADTPDALVAALRVPETVEIMREEGLRYGADLGAEMVPGVSSAGWQSVVSRIYDPDRMSQVIVAGLTQELDGKELDAVTAFFTSELGEEVVKLELAARTAFLDEEVEETARAAFDEARDAQTWQYDAVIELIEDSDLIDFNVMGALNSNYAFYRGLSDGDALEMSEDDMLSDVWAQEDEIRTESAEWLGAYLLMAYQTLSEDELAQYAALYRSEQGRVLNAAIFAAYDQMYEEVSYLLGRAVADQMLSEEL